jgi:pyrroloquinoline quinone (PQQ) biosynthesis protein C
MIPCEADGENQRLEVLGRLWSRSPVGVGALFPISVACKPRWQKDVEVMFPAKLNFKRIVQLEASSPFMRAWSEAMAADCHGHPLWSGPFATVLTGGEPSATRAFKLASVWSVNMVIGSYCFPRYVAALASRADADAVRHGLLENAWDESGSHQHTSRSHFWLAVRLARLLGLSDAEIERVRPLPEAQKYTDEHYRQCAAGDFGFALGMISLIEEFTTPEFTMIFRAFLLSCKAGLGLEPSEFILNGGAEYFTANIADDERHREDMPRLVGTWLHSNGVNLNRPTEVERSLEAIRAGARYSADLRQEFFDGIYHFVSNGGTFRDLVE